MKTRLLPLGWAAAMVLIAASPIVPAAEPLVAFSTQTPRGNKRTLLPVGTSRASFLEHMGEPDAWLSRDVGAYWNQQTNQPQLTRGYDTLLVEFDQARVKRLRIVEEKTIRELLARQEKAFAKTNQAAAPAALLTRR